MVLKAFGGSLSGSFWELLGVPGEFFGASGSTKEGLQIRLRILLGLVCSLLAAEDGLGSADVVFYLLSEPLGVDFELPICASRPQKCCFHYENNSIFEKSAFSIQKWFCNRFWPLSGSFWELLGGSGEL